ncbi:MAG: hypothetical protein HY820_19235 [Acidobacteria bacterium]|nr:hypothetical protein [Acidobacteriota bacterium]
MITLLASTRPAKELMLDTFGCTTAMAAGPPVTGTPPRLDGAARRYR